MSEPPTSPPAEPPIYLALAPCGCVKAVVIDPEHDARAAEELAWAKTRYTIRETDRDWTKRNLRLECPKCADSRR